MSVGLYTFTWISQHLEYFWYNILSWRLEFSSSTISLQPENFPLAYLIMQGCRWWSLLIYFFWQCFYFPSFLKDISLDIQRYYNLMWCSWSIFSVDIELYMEFPVSLFRCWSNIFWPPKVFSQQSNSWCCACSGSSPSVPFGVLLRFVFVFGFHLSIWHRCLHKVFFKFIMLGAQQVSWFFKFIFHHIWELDSYFWPFFSSHIYSALFSFLFSQFSNYM